MYSFNGRVGCRLDEKNRMRIPAKYKADLTAGYKLALGPNNTAFVLPLEEYKKIIDSFGAVSFFDSETQDAIAEFTSSVFDVIEDGQGRFILPAEVKEHAGIDKDVMIVGAGSFLRLESAANFEKRMQGRDISGAFARLKNLGAGRGE